MEFSCGLSTTGNVWCWGTNGDFQFGAESPAGSLVPVLLVPDRQFSSISAMENGVCGLDDTGAAFCWGYNTWEYLLGDPDLTESSAVPVAVSAPVGWDDPPSFVQLAHGSFHSCGLAASGGLYCWGANSRGHLGDGSVEARGRPVAPLSATAVATMAAGENHTCAVDTSGETWCWGSDQNGQAIGSVGEQYVIPRFRFTGTEFVPVALALGAMHSCGLDASGEVRCWGSSAGGRLGRVGDSAEPLPIDGGHTFRTITTRSNHTCGIATDDKVYCWGSNQFGELGSETPGTFSAEPVPVFGQ